MTDLLALKVSLQLNYNNVPALEELELRADPAIPSSNTVTVELEELDSIFGVSLVVNF